MKKLFELAMNDFLAIHVMLPFIEVGDTSSQYSFSGEDIRYEPNVQYAETWTPIDGWKIASHHIRGPAAYYLERIGGSLGRSHAFT